MGDAIKIITYIINSLIILVSLLLIFLYIKSREFHQYQCYNILILSIIIFFDNILRIIPMNVLVLRHIQAFLLTFFDKLILTTITSQALILYLGVCQTKVYFKKEKLIFCLSLILGILISFILALLYIIIANSQQGEGGITNYEDTSIYFYVTNTDFKSISDSIFNGIFLLFNLYYSIILLIYIAKKRKKVRLGIIEDLDYGHHTLKIVLMFIINSSLFIESYLIIYDKIPDHLIDLIYIITCLLVDLYYAINKIIIKEMMKIFCKKYYDKKYPKIKKVSSIEVDDDEGDSED